MRHQLGLAVRSISSILYSSGLFGPAAPNSILISKSELNGMKCSLFVAALTAVALSGSANQEDLEVFNREFEKRSAGNVVRGNNNAVSGSGNKVEGCENRLVGDENNLNGDDNINFGSGSEVQGSNNWVVGNQQTVRGNGIKMFGPQASNFFLRGGYRRPSQRQP